jgi:uncharacterized protein
MSLIRCHACGVVSAVAGRACIACGTILPSQADEVVAPPEMPTLVVSKDSADRQAWHRIRGVAHVFIACLLLLVAGIAALKLGAREVEVDLALTAVMAVLACLVLVASWTSLAPALRASGGIKGVVYSGAGLVGIGLFAYWYFGLIHWLGFPFVRHADAYLSAGYPLWSVYLLISAAPAICEELVFRGYVTARLLDFLSPVETLVVQAALFALVHLSPVVFPSHFVIGAVLGVLRLRTRSIYPGMMAHAGWNAYVVFCEVRGQP